MSFGKAVRILVLTAALLLPAKICLAAKLEKMPFSKEGPGELHCTVTAMFTGTGDGIDNNTLAEVERYVEGNAAINKAQLYTIGTEGETTICVTTSADKASSVADAIKDILPPKPSHGTISIIAGSETYKVP